MLNIFCAKPKGGGGGKKVGREKNKVIRSPPLVFRGEEKHGGWEGRKRRVKEYSSKKSNFKKRHNFVFECLFFVESGIQTFLWENERLGAAGNGEEREEGRAGLL